MKDLTVSKSQFKPQALEYLRWVQKNKKPLLITHYNKPVAKIIPVYSEINIKEELSNTVVKYTNPTHPVGLEDWESINDAA